MSYFQVIITCKPPVLMTGHFGLVVTWWIVDFACTQLACCLLHQRSQLETTWSCKRGISGLCGYFQMLNHGLHDHFLVTSACLIGRSIFCLDSSQMVTCAGHLHQLSTSSRLVPPKVLDQVTQLLHKFVCFFLTCVLGKAGNKIWYDKNLHS